MGSHRTSEAAACTEEATAEREVGLGHFSVQHSSSGGGVLWKQDWRGPMAAPLRPAKDCGSRAFPMCGRQAGTPALSPHCSKQVSRWAEGRGGVLPARGSWTKPHLVQKRSCLREHVWASTPGLHLRPQCPCPTLGRKGGSSDTAREPSFLPSPCPEPLPHPASALTAMLSPDRAWRKGVHWGVGCRVGDSAQVGGTESPPR